MFYDIAGFFGITILLILIDSYILCEVQNTTRILLSIGIDYAILFLYIAARNIVTSHESSATPHAQSQKPRDHLGHQDLKWKEADGRFPGNGQQTATR
jgi:hypothetical protein